MNEILIKFCLISSTIILIGILLVKRFVYFKPSSHFVPTTEAYKTIKHGHLYCWKFDPVSNDYDTTSSKIIIFCHSSSGNLSNNELKMISLRNMGYSVIAFDYSGYGKSSGIPSEQQLYDDASSIVALVRQTYNQDDIIMYGEELGAPIATYVARRYSIGTLILEAPLANIKVLVKQKLPFLSFISSIFREFDTASYLNGYKGKSLIMHSPTDEKIPYSTINELLKLSTSHIELDGSHDYPIIPWDKVQEFINY